MKCEVELAAAWRECVSDRRHPLPKSRLLRFKGTNGKYQELMLQGHLASELEDLLSEEMGIPRRFLTTGFLKGAKPRKAR